MLDWYTYIDEMISVRLPARLKRSRAPVWLFKGRPRREDAGTQLVVAIQTDVPAEIVESMTWTAMHPKPAGDWMGTTWTYRHIGLSRIRQGGVEGQMTQNGPPPARNAHRWHVLYPDCGRWVHVDVFSAMGSLSWEEFEAVTAAIMDSVRLNEDVA